jgi:hypothetical protein
MKGLVDDSMNFDKGFLATISKQLSVGSNIFQNFYQFPLVPAQHLKIKYFAFNELT